MFKKIRKFHPGLEVPHLLFQFIKITIGKLSFNSPRLHNSTHQNTFQLHQSYSMENLILPVPISDEEGLHKTFPGTTKECENKNLS